MPPSPRDIYIARLRQVCANTGQFGGDMLDPGFGLTVAVGLGGLWFLLQAALDPIRKRRAMQHVKRLEEQRPPGLRRSRTPLKTYGITIGQVRDAEVERTLLLADTINALEEEGAEPKHIQACIGSVRGVEARLTRLSEDYPARVWDATKPMHPRIFPEHTVDRQRKRARQAEQAKRRTR
jgi:hypothetical protein